MNNETQTMKELLSIIECVEWAAKDLHYRAHDEWFYSLHLLADKMDFGTAEDDLKEAYFLGYHETLPPTEKEIAELATARMAETPKDNLSLIKALHDMAADGIAFVEQAKREAGLPGGVHAILDGVSQTMLVVKGLAWRSMLAEANDDGESR